MPWRLTVPASSANLGPGFDALGLALNLHLTCRFRQADELTIRADGLDADMIPRDETNLIWQTALNVAEHVVKPLPFIDLTIENEIPVGKGLGSSAAALTAGVVIADQLLGLNWPRHLILNEAAQIEGHPDNVAACVLGSIVASSIDSHGLAHAVGLELPSNYWSGGGGAGFPAGYRACAGCVAAFLQSRGCRVQRAAIGAADCRVVHRQHRLVFRGARGSDSSALPGASDSRLLGDVEVQGAGIAGMCPERSRPIGAGIFRTR